ncbi:hypothetical protein DFQ26_007392 [Actinomortierella ambigua]|nr:hypothetical protein DFQ26_007392 [Actinomortierella ambigua]
MSSDSLLNSIVPTILSKPSAAINNPCSSLKGSKFILSGADVPPQTHLPRLLMAFAGVEFNCQPSDSRKVGIIPPDVHLKHIKEDGSIFELEDVKVITRYLARVLNLGGESTEEDAQLDMQFAYADKILRQWIAEVYSKPNPRDTDAFEQFLSNATPALWKMEEFLIKNGSNGYFFRNRSTYVDIAYYELISFFLEMYPKSAGNVICQSVFQATLKLHKRIQSHPRMATPLSACDPWGYHSCSHVLGLRDTGFLVTDVRQSLKFYTDTFGFLCVNKELNPQTPYGYIEFELPNNTTRLSLLSQEGQQKHRSERMTHGQFSLIVKDVRFMIAEMVAKGVRVYAEPKDHPWGTQARILDPDNNVITIIDIKPGFQ